MDSPPNSVEKQPMSKGSRRADHTRLAAQIAKGLVALACLAGIRPMSLSAAEPRHPAVTNSREMFAGINLASGGFAPERIPGRYGTDYIYPDLQTAAPFLAMGMTAVRVPFLWERIQPAAMGPLDPVELGRLDRSLAELSEFRIIVIDLHNYARYRGQLLDGSEQSAAQLADLWRRLALHYRGSSRIAFGLMNEPHDLEASQWRKILNLTVAAIRASGSTNLILVPGVRWSGGHSWFQGGTTSNAAQLHGFKDPGRNFLFEIHQYLDASSSGTEADCVSQAVGRERLSAVTHWLRAEHAGAVLAEFGVPPTSACLAALDDLVTFLDANSDVWRGWTYWAGGAWWGNYSYSIQPQNGSAKPQSAVLQRHLLGYHDRQRPSVSSRSDQ